MSAMFYALLVEAALLCLAVVGWIWQMDRNAELRESTMRAKRGTPIMLAPLPVAKLHVATAYRRRCGR